MRILLSLVALFAVIAIADVGLSPSANATVLTTDVHALKTEQAGVAELARTTCWWRNGRRDAPAFMVNVAGGATVVASAVGDEISTV